MGVIDFKDLPRIREKHKNEKIAVCAGVFDLTHAGHILFFEDCKKYGDILVVVLGNDFNVRSYKGPERPVLNEHVRLKNISSLRAVDYVLLDINAYNGDFLAVLIRVFQELQPEFYIINDDAYDMPRRYELVKGFSTKLVILPRSCPPEFGNISTSAIIEKIRKGNNDTSEK